MTAKKNKESKANFQDLFEAVCRIETGQEFINERCVAHAKIMEGHTLTLYGQNGDGGIVAAVRDLKNCKNGFKENMNWWRGITQGLAKDFIRGVFLVAIVLLAEHWSIIEGLFRK